ncbi:Acyltransferase family, partial [Globisporangium splendens]
MLQHSSLPRCHAKAASADGDTGSDNGLHIQAPISENAPVNASELKDVLSNGVIRKAPAKILFLDGVRGLAAIFVVTQHSGYMSDINLGACAVDIFFVLSSFLLTMLFYKKSAQLLAQNASLRKWGYTLADYFSKRFFRVYPLFALVAIVIWTLPRDSKKRYYVFHDPDHYDLFKVLTFDFPSRYHVFWTLPLEIAYYFLIPVFVLAVLRLRRVWWVPFIPLYTWIVYAGLYSYRTSHYPLRPHIPTFLSGSMAAVVFVKLDAWLQQTAFQFHKWHMLVVRGVESVTLAVLLSVCFRGLFFHWVKANPVSQTPGFPFVSVLVTILIVLEMLWPSSLSSALEWSVLRYWGKISFSVYLLHSFVIYNDVIRHQKNYYDKLVAHFGLICLLATASYHLVEYPSQLLAQRISKKLAAREAAGVATSTRATYLPVATKTDTEEQQGYANAT